MNKHMIAVAAALALGGLVASPVAKADEIRLFAQATFGDNETGFGNVAYGWNSGGNSIWTLGASMFVSGGNNSDFTFGVNGGYTYLFNPEGNTGFVEASVGALDVGEFSDMFFEGSAGYRWYLSDRAAVGWNVIGWQELTADNAEGSAFTRLQLIISFD